MRFNNISFILILLMVTYTGCEYESQPTQISTDAETQILAKKPISAELITFAGDLAGEQIVEGCCPNAGPFPEYTMNLKQDPFEDISGEHDGNIFMNAFGRKLPWAYIVQFWWTDDITNSDTTFIEVRGGVLEIDRKNKITSVIFNQDTCWIWYPDGQEGMVLVDFTLERMSVNVK